MPVIALLADVHLSVVHTRDKPRLHVLLNIQQWVCEDIDWLRICLKHC
jgi:hypothetical protein